MRESLGNKRHELSNEDIHEIVRLYSDYKENEYSKIFDNEEFGYTKVIVERRARDIHQLVSVGADGVAPLSRVQPEKLLVTKSMSPYQSEFPSEPRTTVQSSLPITVAPGPSLVAPVGTAFQPAQVSLKPV